MTGQTLTIHVPEPLFEQLQRRARQTRRSVEDETLDVLTAAMPLEDELPPGLTEALASLERMDDSSLWNTARSTMPPDARAQLTVLGAKQQREGLRDDEAGRLAQLVDEYERCMLLRAQAAALLKKRGHDVGGLLAS